MRQTDRRQTAAMAERVAAATPVTVITGFLGSGKTTLLNAVLKQPAMSRAAVLINEIGEIGLDHLLVERIDETTVLLNSGCICCTVRGDLVAALRQLYARRVREDVPAFDRVVVETTGLADPAPVLHTFFSDLFVSACYRLDGIVATVDAAHGDGQLDRHPEALKQAAIADRLLVTKTDIVAPEAGEALCRRLGRINPAAAIATVLHGQIAAETLFDFGLFDSERGARIDAWLRADGYHPADDAAHGHGADVHRTHDASRHDKRIAAFCLVWDRPLPWHGVNAGLERLVAAHGDSLLRVKAIVNLQGDERPVVMHGVQHVFHPPLPLAQWPSDDRRSRFVFITRDLPRSTVAAAMESAVGLQPIR